MYLISEDQANDSQTFFQLKVGVM